MANDRATNALRSNTPAASPRRIDRDRHPTREREMNTPTSQIRTYPPMDTRELLERSPVEVDMDQFDDTCTLRRCIACDAPFTDGRGGVCASCVCRGSAVQFIRHTEDGARARSGRRVFWAVALIIGGAIVALLVAGVCR